MCQHLNITVTGKVQGVWFRKYTKEKADALQLKGTVQNLPTGEVYIEVEGADEKVLKKFTDWLYTGSPLSQVNDVIIVSGTCKNYENFTIIR